jgi:hypothetical protein
MIPPVASVGSRVGSRGIGGIAAAGRSRCGNFVAPREHQHRATEKLG